MGEMKSHEVFKRLLQTVTAKQLSSQMGLSSSIIYKWGQPHDEEGGSGAANPLDRVEQLMELTGDNQIAQWVCERAGGFFVKNPVGEKYSERSVVTATNKTVQEFAEMLSLIATAALDNSITDEESREIRARWESVKSIAEDYVNCCERGNFKDLRDHVKHPEKLAEHKKH